MLDELEGIFRAEGIAGLSVGDLARRLGTSRTTLYRLAPGKQKLIDLVIGRMLRRFEEEVETAVRDAETPSAKLTACIRAGVACPVSPPNLARDLWTNPATAALREDYLDGSRRLLAGLLENGTSSGAFHSISVALIVEIVDAAQTRFRDSAVLDKLGLTCEQAAESLAEILLHGIGGDGPCRAARPLAG